MDFAKKDWHNTLCCDFDGVIASYGGDSIAPVKGVVEGFIRLIEAGWYIEVFSGRSVSLSGRTYIRDYFSVYLTELEKYFDSGRIVLAESKPVAKVYLDDRGMTFTSWADITPDRLNLFRAWWQHPASDV